MHMPFAGSDKPSMPRSPLRRLSVELVLIVLAKILFFSLLWWYVAAHFTKADTRPSAIEHLFAPSTSSTPETKP